MEEWHKHFWIIIGTTKNGFPIVSCPDCGETIYFNGRDWHS
jgi:hypothetical protein